MNSASAVMPYVDDEYGSTWEGTSPNAARAYDRMNNAGGAPDNSWLERLLGRRQAGITSQPLPEPYGPAAPPYSESPFGGPPPVAPPPAKPEAKPASKITSGSDIADRVDRILRNMNANAPQPVAPADFGRPPSEYRQQGDPLAQAINGMPNAQEPPPPRVPINMRREQPRQAAMAGPTGGSQTDQLLEFLANLVPPRGTLSPQEIAEREAYAGPESVPSGPRDRLFGGNTFGGNIFGGNEFGGNTYGGNTFGARQFGASARQQQPAGPSRSGELPPYSTPPEIDPRWYELDVRNRGIRARLAHRAEGGEIPGFMRGGYPELRTAPIRHFDSGGESYVPGDGDARADDVPARLSSGEFVLDGETVAMLGNGNSSAGAKKLEEFRQNVRRHKGKALAKGKFSPDAKNPMEYLIGNPIGDGIRRLGKGKQ